jgi:hypothetical protein
MQTAEASSRYATIPDAEQSGPNRGQTFRKLLTVAIVAKLEMRWCRFMTSVF